MKRFSSFVALCLTCTGVLVSACSGAETQDVLLAAPSGSTSGTGDKPGTDPSDVDSGTGGTTTDDCTPEEEPNDNEGEANTLAPVRCGTLSSDDQKDFLMFRLKPTTTTLSITLTGRVRLRVSVGGEDTVELTPDSTSEIPFVMDEDYVVEVTALNSGKNDVNWRVAIVEE